MAKLATFQVSDFTLIEDAGASQLVADASDINFNGPRREDNCITVLGFTAGYCNFKLTEVKRDRDNDITEWVFSRVAPCAIATVRIFND